MREISIRKKTSRFGDRSSDPEALIDAASRCSRPEAEVLQNLRPRGGCGRAKVGGEGRLS